jgi:hypothetical protein
MNPRPSPKGAFGALPLPRFVGGSISKEFLKPLQRQGGMQRPHVRGKHGWRLRAFPLMAA